MKYLWFSVYTMHLPFWFTGACIQVSVLLAFNLSFRCWVVPFAFYTSCCYVRESGKATGEMLQAERKIQTLEYWVWARLDCPQETLAEEGQAKVDLVVFIPVGGERLDEELRKTETQTQRDESEWEIAYRTQGRVPPKRSMWEPKLPERLKNKGLLLAKPL